MIWNKTSDETEKQDGKASFVHDLLQSQNIGKYLLKISFHLVQICVCWIRCRIQNWHKMRLGVQHVLGQVASMLIRKDAIQVFERFSQQESFHRIFMRASLFKLCSEPWLFLFISTVYLVDVSQSRISAFHATMRFETQESLPRPIAVLLVLGEAIHVKPRPATQFVQNTRPFFFFCPPHSMASGRRT
jgi:hypothetical protein